MKITFTPEGWTDYVSWRPGDKQTLRKINRLITAIVRDENVGKPELLTGDLSGWASRRIDREHRLVYRVTADTVEIAACRGHYGG